MNMGPVPTESDALIEHILSRYHEVHRRELTDLVRLARKVERVHAPDPLAPRGVADLLEAIRVELESHMQKEEQVLFPIMRSGGSPMIAHPIDRMRAEHADHLETLRQLASLAHGFEWPAHACRSWQALYGGTRKFTEDLQEHIALENERLFPLFEASAMARVTPPQSNGA